MKAYTWINNHENDPRWRFINNYAAKHEALDLLENYWIPSNRINQAIVQDLMERECDIFFVHDSDINHADIQQIFYNPVNYHVVLFSGGCGNHYYSERCIRLFSTDMLNNFHRFVTSYLNNNRIDLSILLGGWNVYSRIARNRILNCFYNEEDHEFITKPERPKEEDLKMFAKAGEIAESLLNCECHKREVLFVELRDLINQQIIEQDIVRRDIT